MIAFFAFAIRRISSCKVGMFLMDSIVIIALTLLDFRSFQRLDLIGSPRKNPPELLLNQTRDHAALVPPVIPRDGVQHVDLTVGRRKSSYLSSNANLIS